MGFTLAHYASYPQVVDQTVLGPCQNKRYILIVCSIHAHIFIAGALYMRRVFLGPNIQKTELKRLKKMGISKRSTKRTPPPAGPLFGAQT